ncbi:nucleoside deaminase [Polluticaenibacter yanchengensis]|uniref:tRNA-specific adenosine deaminase n=1 Tax=Polluticaenibacter yanchengensis TaxID=3014562 RepID=A0ABT4UL55_9BACT|nr:nucleoside deaminase [Chitinophagaceae bacterium LY-5]
MDKKLLEQDEQFMTKALEEARIAFEKDEVPIGAVIVQNNTIISRGHNLTEQLKDVTAHAEMIALTSAFNYIGAKYLPDATLYVTIEPCNMCAGALYWSKIGRIVFGAKDIKHGYSSSYSKSPFHPKTRLSSGILEEQCSLLMKTFFENKRK